MVISIGTRDSSEEFFLKNSSNGNYSTIIGKDIKAFQGMQIGKDVWDAVFRTEIDVEDS